jgi:hypothetical protein
MDSELVVMSLREIERAHVMRAIQERRLTQKQAASQLVLSVRQVERLFARYKRDGPTGLVSRRRGQLALAYERGFDRISSLFYFNARRLHYESSSDDIRREITSQLGIARKIASKLYIPDREFDQFEYRVDYLSPDRRFGVIRMRPRQ